MEPSHRDGEGERGEVRRGTEGKGILGGIFLDFLLSSALKGYEHSLSYLL